MLHNLVLEHVDSRGNIHVLQNGLLQESPTIIILVHFDKSERKSRMNHRNCRQGLAFSMLRQHLFESEVNNLVAVEGEESLIINVTFNRQAEAFARSPGH